MATDEISAEQPPQRGLHEDWTASILGLLVLIVALGLAQWSRPETVTASIKQPPPLSAEEKKAGKKQESPWTQPLKGWIGKPSKWNQDPTAAFRPQAKPAKKTAAEPKKEEPAKEAPKDQTDAAPTKTEEGASKPAESKPTEAKPAETKSADTKSDAAKPETSKSAIENPGPIQWQGYVGAYLISLLIGFAACLLQKNSIGRFIPAFTVVFLVAVLARSLAAQAVLDAYNLEYALWALVVGMLVSNTVGTPQWLKPGVRSELYIKTGLVLLGAEVLFTRLLALGAGGVLVSWLVTPIVLIGTYIFGQRILKMESRSLNLVISADMSVCGVSAAIATAAACKAKKEELSLAIGLSLIFTVLMMIVMPVAIERIGLDPKVAGAWLGGTIDSTGAVSAAATSDYLGQIGLETAVTVKMIQNLLIGATAICVAIYWTRWVEPQQSGDIKVGRGEIWRRFPKFVLGFLAASVICSVLFAMSYYGQLWVGSAMDGVTKPTREWLFCLAFVSIGLETNFKELMPYLRSGKALVLYLCGQAFNLLLSFIMAYLVFGILFKSVQ